MAGNWLALAETRRRMNDAGIEVSLFIAPDPEQMEAAARMGSQFIELHTGAFAENFHRKRERARELERLIAPRGPGARFGPASQRRPRLELPESWRAAAKCRIWWN